MNEQIIFKPGEGYLKLTKLELASPWVVFTFEHTRHKGFIISGTIPYEVEYGTFATYLAELYFSINKKFPDCVNHSAEHFAFIREFLNAQTQIDPTNEAGDLSARRSPDGEV